MLTKRQIVNWLDEDIHTGDITSEALINSDTDTHANFILKENGVLCGLEYIEQIFTIIDTNSKVKFYVKDGEKIKRGTCIATIKAKYKTILKGERTCLNLLQHLSGIATSTNEYVELIKQHRAKIFDTRKTLPGYRELEKKAVKTGGGNNHRIGLYDQFLIKENHLKYFKSEKNPFAAAIEAARKFKHNTPIMIEVENCEEFSLALGAEPDVILLDNMSNTELRRAVKLRDNKNNKTLCEASGGINKDTITDIAATGVDRISIGAITHSSKNLDISLLIED